MAGELERPVHIIAVKDMAGLLKPAAARAVQGAARGHRPADPFPYARHVRHRGRHGARGGDGGVDAVDAAMDAFPAHSQPCLSSIEALKGNEQDSRLDAGWIRRFRSTGGGSQPVRRVRERPEGAGLRSIFTRCPAGSSQPEGARLLGLEARWHRSRGHITTSI